MTMRQLFEQLGQWVEQIVTWLGYPGITLVMLIENLFPPIPSELVMPLAGFFAADGKLTFAGACIAGTLGSVLGAVALYYIGLWADEPLIRRFVRRYGRWLTISERDLDRALSVFHRRGEIVVFACRMVPLLRSLVSIPAGMHRMPMGKFLLFTTAGSAIWTVALALAGFILRQNWGQVLAFINAYQNLTLATLVIATGTFLVTRTVRRRANIAIGARKRAEQPAQH
jgi:membrane protein DedA with SNARE-associated domain